MIYFLFYLKHLFQALKLLGKESYSQYQNEHQPNDLKHITSCDMTKEYAKVHKDNRTHHNNMYLVPPHRYKK